MRKALRAWLSILVLGACPLAAFGRILPSFNANNCAWHATHIVVVAAGARINGIVEVKESWKGDLQKGERINVPELAKFAAPRSRAVSQALFDKLARGPQPPRPPFVTCSRMILFLKRDSADGAVADTLRMRWAPPDQGWGQMDVSVAWVEAGETYAFHQECNPGPSRLIRHGRTEKQMKADVLALCAAQEALTEALRCPKPARVAEACRKVVHCESPLVEGLAVDELAGLGRDALPVLRHLLKDASLEHLHPALLGAMARVGGIQAGPDLTAVVEQDLAFWKKASRRLRPGWHDGKGLREDDAERLQARYSRTDAALSALQGLGFSGCRKVVTEFRDFWRSRPQFRGLDLDQTCQRILDELARPTQRPKGE